MNRVPGFDLTGAARSAHSQQYAATYFVLTAALLAAAFVFRARELRSALVLASFFALATTHYPLSSTSAPALAAAHSSNFPRSPPSYSRYSPVSLWPRCLSIPAVAH